jgi:hypothetical protein
LHFGQRARKIVEPFFLLLDHRRRGLGDEGLVAQLALALAISPSKRPTSLASRTFSAATSTSINRHMRGLPTTATGCRLGGCLPSGFIVEDLDLAELGQRLQNRLHGCA